MGALCALLTHAVTAEQASTDDRETLKPVGLEEMVVVGTRVDTPAFVVPQAVSRISRAEIDAYSYRTTPEALAHLPGVHLQKTAHGQGSPFIRGLTGKQVLILVDGVRLNNSAFRFGPNQYLATVDLNAVERIEVLRGAASALYGTDALGGVINVITDNASAELGTSLKTTYGSADHQRSVALNTRQQWRSWRFTAGGSSHQYAALEGGGNVGEQHHTGYEEHAFYTSIARATANDGEVGLRLNSHAQNDVPRTDKFVNDQEAFLFTDQDRRAATLWWRQPLQSAVADSMRFNVQEQTQSERFTRQRFNSESSRLIHDSIRTRSVTGVLQKSLANANLVYGAEHYRDRVGSRGRRFDGAQITSSGNGSFPDGSRYQSSALFAEYQLQVGSRTDLYVGVRYSHFRAQANLDGFGRFDETYQDTTGSVRMSNGLSDTLRLFAGVSRGFRAPNLDDLVVLKSTNEGVDVPSPDLDPEQSLNYELGLKVDGRRWRSTVTGFYTDFEDLIERRPGLYRGLSFIDDNGNGIEDAGEDPVVQKFNLGRAKMYGLELDGAFHVSDRWSVGAQLAYIYGRNQTGDEPLSRVPPLRAMLKLRRTAPEQRWWAEVMVDRAGRQDRLSARDVSDPRIPADGTPGFTALHLTGAWRIDANSEVILALNNLTDRRYKMHGSGLFEPGRSAKLSYIFRLDR